MKINKIIYLLIASLLLVMTGCDPIVDEQHLSNSASIENVQLKATNTTEGGNEIKLEMMTPGVTGYWYYLLDNALTDTYTFVMPVTGTYNFKYTGTVGSEFFEKTIPVTITKLDHPAPPEWTALLGADGVAGKTWVFAGVGGDGGKWWYMSPPDDPSSAMSAWWNAGGECCPPVDVNGKMHFDLNGARNYNYYASPTSEPLKGTFTMDLKNKKMIFLNSKILGAEAGNNTQTYDIISLTADQMVLYTPRSLKDPGTGWTFIFKPQ